jgi:radical SAM superfamily enzyme YgiQ (UPF0313 family)
MACFVVPDARPARILLVNLNRYDQPYPVYPLGLACLDGALRAAGHDTRVWDARTAASELEAAIAAYAPDFVGLSMRNIDNVQCHNPRSFVHELLAVCRRVRQSTRAPLAIGGSGFSVFPGEIFELTGADFGVHGEGEGALVALLAALRARRPVTGIPGLVFRDETGAVRATPPAAAEAAFHVEPRHDPELLCAYVQQGSLPGIQTQRGCPLKCCYCTYPAIEGRHSRFRSGADVAEEMRRLAAHGVRYAFIVDSVFNTAKAHVVDVCEALIRAETGIEWECFLRPVGLDAEMLVLMKRAGLRHVEFGSDSFADPVLLAYQKSFRWEDILRSSELAHSLEVRYSHFIIFGGPGETRETIEQTLARAQMLKGAYFFATIGMRVYPGTPLWRHLAPETRGETPADYLVEPRFFLEPPLTMDGIFDRLKETQRSASNWAVGDPPPVFVETMAKLRKRGVVGPMWEYAELLQRLQALAPDPAPASRPPERP